MKAAKRLFPVTAAVLFVFGCAISAAETPRHPAQELRAVADAHVAAETAGLPGEVSWSISDPDPRLHIPRCAAPVAFTPPGARLWGRSTVGLRCASPLWTIYLPVTVRVTGDYHVAARPLLAGVALTSDDLRPVRGELTTLPASLVTDVATAAGKAPAISIPAGSPLRLDLLKAPLVVRQGQTVKIRASSGRLAVSSEGRALTNASAGQAVSARTPGGQTVTGVAGPDGTVEIAF